MKRSGFTLIELIVVVVIVGVLAVTALPRFINFGDEASAASIGALFENFRSGTSIYQAACLSRGGDVETTLNDRTNPFDIDGIQSNYTGSCYPIMNTRNQRNINNPRSCYRLLHTIAPSDFYDTELVYSSTNPRFGGENARRVDVSLFEDAIENGYSIFIHQRSNWHSYCHFYNIDGDLTNTPYLLYNAVDGQIVTGTTDISQELDWQVEIERYSGEITQF